MRHARTDVGFSLERFLQLPGVHPISKLHNRRLKERIRTQDKPGNLWANTRGSRRTVM
jgi:hypothetical protein